MEAGKLRSIIRILKAPADERGAPTQDVSRWVEVRTVRASVRPIRGRELWEAEQAQSIIDHRIIIRYDSAVRPSMRVQFEGRTFEILYVIDPEEQHRWMQLMCRELEDG